MLGHSVKTYFLKQTDILHSHIQYMFLFIYKGQWCPKKNFTGLYQKECNKSMMLLSLTDHKWNFSHIMMSVNHDDGSKLWKYKRQVFFVSTSNVLANEYN